MQLIRTVSWMGLSAILVAFVAMNWDRAAVNIWPLDQGFLHFDWPVGVIALVFLALGLLPGWLVAKAARWRLERRISALESALATQTLSQAPAQAPSETPASQTPA